jgi:hypothetical protein
MAIKLACLGLGLTPPRKFNTIHFLHFFLEMGWLGSGLRNFVIVLKRYRDYFFDFISFFPAGRREYVFDMNTIEEENRGGGDVRCDVKLAFESN